MYSLRNLIIICFTFALFSCRKNNAPVEPAAEQKINVSIKHKVGTANFTTGSSFNNGMNESFKLNKFQYYITNIQFLQNGVLVDKETESYRLIKAEDASTHDFVCTIKKSPVNQIRFMIGVDSLRNVSGAQTGALDPLNGMFWTWNTGYIMAKMEGNSPQSNAVNNLVTYHIGGFAGANSTLRWVTLSNAVAELSNGTKSVSLQCDINKFFNGVHTLKIADEPIMMNHGSTAAKYADNYATMFSLN